MPDQARGGADDRVYLFAQLCGMLGAHHDDGSCALVCRTLALLLPRRSLRRRLCAVDA
eukprot:CAMPEP_0206054376 /NCGR_PEP_ID=MMETSP1466-20131121/37907_1 /ASSEMBLY_ACC=CAM_ASM_001126 /TAXON_ID=44452 /ORGANISM="Pavlova gyrans, Strain CCMP608" /LENGTH=57 /DNA_ID=CAMNT_0053429579 /DNA_START=15 /DNA_END=185 /DNA_ORIENTATION=+